MRQLTLEQALEEDKVIFKVTPEQATLASTILAYGFKFAAIIVSNSPYSGRPSYWESEEHFAERTKSDYEDYEEVAIVGDKVELSQENIVFKTQQEIWAYLSATEEHKVIHINECVIMGFKDGKLHGYKETEDLLNINNSRHWVTRTDFEILAEKKMYKVGDKLRVVTTAFNGIPWCAKGSKVSLNVIDTEDSEGVPYLVFPLGSTSTEKEDGVWMRRREVELWKEDVEFKTQQDLMGFKDGKLTDELWRFDEPSFWKPYTEPVKKEWWELIPDGKPVLCWYGDTLFKDDRPIILGLVTKDKRNQFRTGKNGSGVAWKYAIPATLDEVKQYLLENILDETSN